ncbi:MAG: T9SS type A sorting domain-containing protein, partial [Flavipsychrobacter sp.]
KSGTADIKVTDMLGKVVEARMVSYSNADNLVQIDVRNWAKGVYSLAFDDNAGERQNVKLVVQ